MRSLSAAVLSMLLAAVSIHAADHPDIRLAMADHLMACGVTSTLSCDSTRAEYVHTYNCVDPNGAYYNGYAIVGPKEVTVTVDSTDFPPYIGVGDPSGNLMTSAYGTRTATVHANLTQAGKTYFLVVESYNRGDIGAFAVNVTCASSATQPSDPLVLASSRFQVRLSARDQRTGNTGQGVGLKTNDSFGYFAIPALTGNTTDPAVLVKIIDGRPVNGKWWVFYSGLTDLEYTITVTDTFGYPDQTVRTYHNAPGSTCGGFDTSAF